jgi:HxlR-like helix-turn-helix
MSFDLHRHRHTLSVGNDLRSVIFAGNSEQPLQEKPNQSLQQSDQQELTLILRNLERDGLLVRTVHPTSQPTVEYTLTEAAHELHQSLAIAGGDSSTNHIHQDDPRPGRRGGAAAT